MKRESGYRGKGEREVITHAGGANESPTVLSSSQVPAALDRYHTSDTMVVEGRPLPMCP
ncbi:MAG: hypothetical protein V3S41_08190 [Spirochaetia bacterium]